MVFFAREKTIEDFISRLLLETSQGEELVLIIGSTEIEEESVDYCLEELHKMGYLVLKLKNYKEDVQIFFFVESVYFHQVLLNKFSIIRGLEEGLTSENGITLISSFSEGITDTYIKDSLERVEEILSNS